MSDIRTSIIQLLHDQSGVRVSEINDETKYEDLGFDSLDEVELAMMVEEEFEIEIPDSDFEGLRDVKGLVAYVTARLQVD